jgi:hypothetical protein
MPPPRGLGVGGRSSSENGESGAVTAAAVTAAAVTAAVTAASGVTASPPMPPEALGEGVCVLEAKKAVFTLTAGASLLLFLVLLLLLLPLLRAPAAAVLALLLLVLARKLRRAAARACMTSKLMAFCSVCPTTLHTLQAACARGQSISPAAAAAAPVLLLVAVAVAVSKHLRRPSTTRLKMSASRDSL